MIKDIEYNNIYKLGFFNKEKEKNEILFKEYEKEFDININDGNLHRVNDFITDIFK